MRTALMLLMVTVVLGDVVTITKELFSNYFTDQDVAGWMINGNGAPVNHKQSYCNGTLLFGGYNLFVGDQHSPISLTKTYSTAVPHWTARIHATIYKIDSWNNQNLFVTVDGLTQRVYTWNSSFNGTDICGTPNPVVDGLNPSYSDGPVSLDINVTHNASTLVLGFSTNLNSWVQSWGIRQIQIDLDYCDRSCKTCDGPTSANCLSCDATVANSVSTLSSGYYTCQCLNTVFTEKLIDCTVPPCLRCIATCDSGQYFYLQPSYPDVPSKTCLKCNTACSTCSGPVNNAVQCTACSPGYYSSTVFGPCSNCFVGCATCNGLTNTSCTSCSGTYFYLTSNNSCVTSCPALYYPSESLNQCISCDTTCLTCDGNGPNFCTSCSAGSYLSGTQCVALCTVPMMGYVTDNTCVSICPFSNFVQTSDNTCRPCPANCGICFNSTECTTCINNSFLSGKFCLLTCPAGTYPNSFTILCQPCHSSCLTCWGPLQQHCLSCLPTRFLFNNSCSLTCPTSTFVSSTLCLSCHSTCLTCTGPSEFNCSACAVGYLYHLNKTMCVTDCPKGDSVDNDLLTCWSCLPGEVTYTNQCRKCDNTCDSCTSVDFQDCTGCVNGREFKFGMCVCPDGMMETGQPTCQPNPKQVQTAIIGLILSNFIMCLLLQPLFKNKTNLLSMLTFLQQLSYLFYISTRLPYELQPLLLTLYNSHPSHLVKLTPYETIYTKDRYALNNKTGLFVFDAGYALIIMVVVGIIYGFMLLLRRTCRGFEFWGKIPKMIVKKWTPYLFAMTFELVVMEVVLAFTLNVLYFQEELAGVSIAFMVVVGLAILLTFFWKVQDTQGMVHYGLLYNYQINYQSPNAKTPTKSSSFKPILPLLSKLVIPILLPVFNRQPLLQSSLLIFIFAGKLILQLSVSYKRKIYFWTLIGTTVMQIIASLFMVLTVNVGMELGVGVKWAVLAGLAGYNLLTILQAVVNYKLYGKVARYLYIHITNELCS